MVIPTVASEADAELIVSRLDGIVFFGGEDINPAWYGEEVLNETVYMDPVRDYSDSLLARAALSSGKPILAICRGCQLMNVMLGGSLYQDLPSQKGTGDRHAKGAFHMIGLEEGSLLATFYGPESVSQPSAQKA